MDEIILQIKSPDFLKTLCEELQFKIIREGKLNKDRWGISFSNELPRPLKILIVYLRFITEINEILDHLNIIVEDIESIPDSPSTNRSKQFKKYLLLTRLYFYEVSRLEDVFGRFLYGMQKQKFLTKVDRKEMKDMLYEQLEMSFKIRNAMLHGSFEWGNKDREIEFMSTLDEHGYEPKLVPLDGGEHKEFDKDIRHACSDRALTLLKHGRNIRETMNSYVSISARWLNLKGHFQYD